MEGWEVTEDRWDMIQQEKERKIKKAAGGNAHVVFAGIDFGSKEERKSD